MTHENALSITSNALAVLGTCDEWRDDMQRVIEQFCGVVVYAVDELQHLDVRCVYVCGDLSLLGAGVGNVRVIESLSWNSDEVTLEGNTISKVTRGQVPRLVHNMGVLFPRFFEEEDLFERIQTEHVFQNLTESTKDSKALRTGIYLTDVTRDVTDDMSEVFHFRLLRCSSNLTGPTDNFRETDRMIMGAINQAARDLFEHETSLNHVLAQVYTNTSEEVGERRRERKAKISAHSDKTKDMREDGLIAFCTFYDPEGFEHLTPSEDDPNDWCYKKSSGLTTLHFKLKSTVDNPTLVKSFSVTLYPNSVFIIPLSTNRLYTHAIRPSHLNIDRIPTRMGYVARSSSAEALFKDGQTYLKQDDMLVPLEHMTRETMSTLRRSYFQENSTDDEVSYGEVRFSMNSGDYQKPIY